MPKRYRSREVVRGLERAGFSVLSQKGSHIKLRKYKEGKKLTVIVPAHDELAVGTFSSVLEQAHMNQEEFKSFL